MREPLGKEFDVRVLNPSGVEIDLPFWAFKRLKKLHLLERDQGNRKTENLRARVWVNGDLGSAGIQAGPQATSVASRLSAHSSETHGLFQFLSQSAWA